MNDQKIKQPKQKTKSRNDFLELHEWRKKQIKKGIRAADEGRFASDAEVNRIFNKYKNA